MTNDEDRLRELVATVAASYFSNTHVAPTQISAVVAQIAASLITVTRAGAGSKAGAVIVELERARVTRSEIARSVTPDALISFEDGRGYKTLRRHLSKFGLSPERYRAKWGLPSDYPVVAANYKAARSEMAKALGLGRKPANSQPPPATNEV